MDKWSKQESTSGPTSAMKCTLNDAGSIAEDKMPEYQTDPDIKLKATKGL